MKDDLRAILGMDDLGLFMRGGCHVFAVTLVDQLPEEGYEIVCASVVSPLNPHNRVDAAHILCHRDDFIVHAPGVERWTLYAERTASGYRDRQPSIWGDALCLMTTTSATELFAPVSERWMYGPVNRWEHGLDADFVAEVRRRAVDYIGRNRDRLRLSIAER